MRSIRGFQPKQSDNMYYRHTQVGWIQVLLLGGLLIGLVCFTSSVPKRHLVEVELLLVWVGLMLMVCMLVFGSMTVTVNETALTVQFGLSLFRKTIRLMDIESCCVVRNRWWWGWGIRRIPGGWLYNVSGLDAVELVMKDGHIVRVGTDEPDALAKFLQMKLRQQSRLGSANAG